MTDSDTGDFMVDDDGYPTNWGIQQLRDFNGTPAQFIDLVRQLWWPPTFDSRRELPQH